MLESKLSSLPIHHVSRENYFYRKKRNIDISKVRSSIMDVDQVGNMDLPTNVVTVAEDISGLNQQIHLLLTAAQKSK